MVVVYQNRHTPSENEEKTSKGGGEIIVVGDNCRMADKIKNIASFFFSKKWGIVVVGDKKYIKIYLFFPI